MHIFPAQHRDSTKRIQLLLAGAALLINTVGALSLDAALTHAKKVQTVVLTVQEEISKVLGIVPARLVVPSIGVDTEVEEVGLREDGFMDIPTSVDTVGWFALGYHPGQLGSAVLAGHLDTQTGDPAIFWNLRKMNIGDLVYIDDADGNRQTFKVVRTGSYPPMEAPMMDIFGPANKPKLALITCNGEWEDDLASYDQRLVVYTEAVDLPPVSDGTRR